MRFFTDPTPFTHHARLYGVPCYATADADLPMLVGTNALWDWCLAHVVPLVHLVNSMLLFAAVGADAYEPPAWPIEIVGPIRVERPDPRRVNLTEIGQQDD